MPFDWHLLENLKLAVPFMVSGGINAANVAEALRVTRATGVDVSSGVEVLARREGHRDDPRVHRCSSRSGPSVGARQTRKERHMTLPKPNSFRIGPDDHGHFGIFGGRFVAETLMPLILDLEKAYAEAKADRCVPRRDERLPEGLCRPSVAALLRRAAVTASRWRKDLSEARGAEPHRFAQGQQRARPDPAGAAHGQEAHHRRDRRRPARRRNGNAVRALRPRMRRLHGRRGCGASGAERVPHGDAGRQGRSRCSRARAR